MTQISWQQKTEQQLVQGSITGSSAGFDLAIWGDFNGTGKDTLLLTDTVTLVGDFDGDGVKDTAVAGLGVGVSFSKTGNTVGLGIPASAVCDPGATTMFLAQNEGAAFGDRFCVGDFNGDGLDDIMLHGVDGYLYVWTSTGTGFTGPTKSQYMVGGACCVESFYTTHYITQHYFIRAIPCDLNGDGRTDYVFVENLRTFGTYLNLPNSPSPYGYTNLRMLIGVLSLPNGNFSAPFVIDVLRITDADDALGKGLNFDDVYAGVLAGDFNGDGKTDFLVLGSVMNPFSRWTLRLSRGDIAGVVTFDQIFMPMPDQVTVTPSASSGSESVFTYFKPCTSAAWATLAQSVSNAFGPTYSSIFAGIESGGGTTNAFIYDVNGDGLADYVWYVADNTSDNPSLKPGWYAMLSTGKFTSAMKVGASGTVTPGTGFVGPVRLDFLNFSGGTPYTLANQSFTSVRVSTGFDLDGDGHMDFSIQGTVNGRPSGGVEAFQAVNPNQTLTNPNAPFGFVDTVTTVTEGVDTSGAIHGKTTSLDYLAAKDSTIYTPGVPVNYPIRELREATPVVADLFKDSGDNVPADRAHFSYQYSGNRLDLSGRGSLGFHSFVTLDAQTSLLKYQFLTQSFPMTGLAAREQTYRYWADSTNGYFRLISTHDNTVVFDSVVNGGQIYGLYPFISQAIESRWEDSNSAHFQIPLSTPGTSAQAENLFSNPRPAGAYITITATSLFDGQSTPQTTFPTALTSNNYSYYASDTTGIGADPTMGGGSNAVGGTSTASIFSSLPGKITYGNLAQLSTNYGDGNTETVQTTYYTGQTNNLGVLTLFGLPKTVTTTVVSTNGGTQIAPVESYAYATINNNPTPLVLTKMVYASKASPAGSTYLDLTTTYNYDNNGRVTSTGISCPGPKYWHLSDFAE